MAERAALDEQITRLTETRAAYDLVIDRHTRVPLAIEPIRDPAASPVQPSSNLPPGVTQEAIARRLDRLTTNDAITAAFEHEAGWLSLRDIEERVVKAGWTTTSARPVQIVRNTAMEKVNRGELEMTKDLSGLLRFRTPRAEAPSTSTESGASANSTDHREEVMGNDNDSRDPYQEADDHHRHPAPLVG